MNWFRKSYSKSRASPRSPLKHKRVKKSTVSADGRPFDPQCRKTLRTLRPQHVEVLDPDDFFEDPEHVRNYREEARFLSLMSEWVIVENPATMPDNFFSADFEDELLQLRTQDTDATVRSVEHVSGSLPPHLHTDEPDAELSLEELERRQRLLEQQQRKLRGCKRRLCELLFANNIELGIALPQKRRRRSKKRRRIKLDLQEGVLEEEEEEELNAADVYGDDDDDGDGEQQRSYSSTSNLSSLSGERYQTSSFQTNASTLQTSATKHTSLTLVNTCANSVLKDCAINRKQLKTEALARSIMGAIGKCPARDHTPRSSVADLIEASGDSCHPDGWHGCDHYDIKQFFKLDDYGNILLNINHIEEIRGYGFAVAHNRRLYRRCRKECQIVDEHFKRQQHYCRLLKCLLRLLRDFVNGEFDMVDGVKEAAHWDVAYDDWTLEWQLLVASAGQGVSEREM